MRILVRSFAALVLAALMFSGWSALAQPRAGAANNEVTIYDTTSPPYRPLDGETGTWGYGPSHLTVTQGDQIVFNNPSTNTQAHTVTSLAFSSGSDGNFTNVAIGTEFDSSPGGRDARLAPGTSWTLDTSTLTPGQYVYFCAAHPWMVGTFTLLAPSQ